MKNLLLLLFLVISIPAQSADLVFELVNLKSDQGKVVLYLFPDLGQKSFPVKPEEGKPVCTVVSKILDSRASIQCSNVPKGKYAAFAFHDENENGEVDHHWYGPPKEAFGFSKNVEPLFGPPDFEETAFMLTHSHLSMTIRIRPFF